MSNVLIGIIGVILFIGLALAGALILGDDFKNASNASKAATAIANLDQVTQAAAMYQLKTGGPYSLNPIAGLSPRFLRVSTLTPLKEFGVIDFRGANGFPSAAGNPAFSAGMGGGTTEATNRICNEINDVFGIAPDADGGPPYSAGLPTQNQGCFRLRGTYGDITANGNFTIIYKRI
jgi:hypothetical protein